jgi:Flp pilus assembly protein TadG
MSKQRFGPRHAGPIADSADASQPGKDTRMLPVEETPVGAVGRGTSGRRWTRARRFARNEDGVTAVEFGFVAVPFVALMYAILETAIIFFAGQALETAVGDTARLIRTGQAHEDGMTEAEFRAEVCERVFNLFDCDGGLSLDVRTFPTFDSIDLTVEVDEDGNLVTDDFDFQIGEAGDIVVVRTLYEWPVLINMLGNDLGNLANGKHVISATAVFKNEPFPW